MSADITRRLFGDRTLTGHDDADGESIAGWPEMAYESMRAINHLTSGAPIPAPVVYSVLGNLKGVGHMLPQALNQLGSGLAASLDEFDVYDHKREPGESVSEARSYLELAAVKAEELGRLLGEAQVAINSQGYELAAGGKE